MPEVRAVAEVNPGFLNSAHHEVGAVRTASCQYIKRGLTSLHWLTNHYKYNQSWSTVELSSNVLKPLQIMTIHYSI